MHIVNIHEAKTNLSKLIQEVLDGNEVVIAKNKNPIVKIVRLENQPIKRKLGLGKNKIQFLPDFDKASDIT